MTDATRLKATVYVGGLDHAVSESILLDAFAPFGEIVEVSLPKPDLPSSTDPHRGFGYVEFEVAADATEAIDNMDQSELFGRVIKVAQAKPQKDSNEGLGSKTAIWEQEGWLAKQAASEENRSAAPATGDKDDADSSRPTDQLSRLDVAGPSPIVD